MTKFHFTSSTSPESIEAADLLKKKYGQSTPDEADCVVALGGDGLMLLTLHTFMNTGKPIYGMNRGSVGFLMNEFEEDNLDKRVEAAIATNIHPLRMTATDMEGETFSAEALNEVSMLRQSYQAAKLKIIIDGKVRMEELICDGVLVATPQGSTAYNLSAHGPILPINAPLLALTPISPFRPRRWRGALLPNRAKVEIEVLEADKRPVNAVADHAEIKGVQKISVCEDEKRSSTILFDPDHTWDERIMSEQFIT